MVKKTYHKTITRMFKGNIKRLIVIMALTCISLAIVTGIGLIAPKMREASKLLEATSGRVEYVNFLANGIERISIVFPMLFIIVTALVVFMTITRLVECDRMQIGCYKTLGYSRSQIIWKYLSFTFVGGLIGCLTGIILGYFVILPVLYAAIQGGTGGLPEVGSGFPGIGLYSAIFMFGFMLFVTFIAAYNMAKEKPTSLFTGKAPKPGRKILFEKIPFIWNRLKYKYKSMLRNVLRYKIRFFMTVFSMLLATVLVFCGLSLSSALGQTNPDLMETIRSISSILIIAAVLLNMLVIYNITNINIEERKREIATLKVLGYRNTEVAGYIFREIFVLTVVGVLLGLPAGYSTMAFMFDFLQFGGIEFVEWHVWIFTGGLAFVSLGLADLFTFRKLLKTDMNGSLKTIE